MKNRVKITFVLMSLCFLLLGACNNQNTKGEVDSIHYNFKEPISFPFEVNEISSEIDIQRVDYLHQFIFTYYNSKSTQQINYILSKVLDETEDVDTEGKIEVNLDNGKVAYYEESSTSQKLWWKREDGFIARFIYFIDKNTSPLGEFKLEKDEPIKLANQVQ
ncbi:hypothetical protein ACTWQB_05735 [Piscibacillus sp. B03]|uniref:hypothetical protein n=1 Tax=Piscibacillus sp. B03 TaxID=3457430 RepID=UPI003FCE884B